MAGPLIHLKVVSPEKTLVDSMVFSVTLPGTVSPFEVLPGHAALISSLEKGAITYRTEDGEESLPIRTGFVRVGSNQVIAAVEE